MWFNGTAKDSLTAGQDTIRIDYFLNNEDPIVYTYTFNVDTIDGADSIVVKIKGKLFAEDDWTTISTSSELAVASTLTTTVTTSTNNLFSYYTSTEDSVFLQTATIVSGNDMLIYDVIGAAYYYRYLRFEVYRTGVGNGVLLDYVNFKFWERP